MLRRPFRPVLAAAMLLLAVPAASFAQTVQEAARNVASACEPDVAEFCSAASGRREVGQCLSENKDSLSAACQDAVATLQSLRGQ